MSAIDDIDYLLDQPYGIRATQRRFEANQSASFYEADREWEGMRELCDERLRKQYCITGLQVGIYPHESPLLYHFRRCYDGILKTKPQTYNECDAGLTDMLTTLQTIRELNDVTPLTDGGDHKYLSWLVAKPAEDVHIEWEKPSMVAVETATVVGWNQRKSGGKTMTPWDGQTFQQTMRRLLEISSIRLSPQCLDGTAAHVILRKATMGREGKEIIDIASNDKPGVTHVLLARVLEHLSQQKRIRLHNLLEQHH